MKISSSTREMKKKIRCVLNFEDTRNMNRERRIGFPLNAPVYQRHPIFHTRYPHRTLSAWLSPSGYKVPMPLVLSWKSHHEGIWRRDKDPFLERRLRGLKWEEGLDADPGLYFRSRTSLLPAREVTSMTRPHVTLKCNRHSGHECF